uniref:Uncharacterized protein n=1 Tax=Plectus sambesii TaxID=2011161 RepID=A0A914WWT6_9BILA
MVWVKPDEVVFGQSLWVAECANPYFVLQRRKGHGTKGFGSLLVQTLDSVFDTRPPPYRILLQIDTEELQVAYSVAVAVQRKEAGEHWEWIEKNLMPTLGSFDSDEDVIKYVRTKIESLVSLEEKSRPNLT